MKFLKYLLAISVLFLLTACQPLPPPEPMMFGIPQSQWVQLTQAQQKEVMNGYYRRQESYNRAQEIRAQNEPLEEALATTREAVRSAEKRDWESRHHHENPPPPPPAPQPYPVPVPVPVPVPPPHPHPHPHPHPWPGPIPPEPPLPPAPVPPPVPPVPPHPGPGPLPPIPPAPVPPHPHPIPPGPGPGPMPPEPFIKPVLPPAPASAPSVSSENQPDKLDDNLK